jgi:hypothetical protein
MQHLLEHKSSIRGTTVFPVHYFERVTGGMYLRQGLTCSYAALAAGDVNMLRQLLLCSSVLHEPFTSRLLLSYAARHSNADCLQEVLFLRRVRIRHSVLVAPQHLGMAAGRTDPWAAGEAQRSASVVTVYAPLARLDCKLVMRLQLRVAPRPQVIWVVMHQAFVCGACTAHRRRYVSHTEDAVACRPQQSSFGGLWLDCLTALLV